MIQTSEQKEKFILVGVETGKDRMEESLAELNELLDTVLIKQPMLVTAR